jgi:AGZA family xanthine/uracil permease-like MFS transporter
VSVTNGLGVGTRYRWLRVGDINAFFGLMLDNIGDLILMVGLLVGVFGFPEGYVLTRMVPGTAIGVLIGDLVFSWMAIRLARRTGRDDVTAMPLGIDTPSTFGMVFLVLGPAFAAAKGRGYSAEAAAEHAWYLGIALIMASGVFKVLCSFGSGWIRRVFPRAGLLGSLVAIALVLISFLPLLDIAGEPVAGMVSMVLILACLTARWRLPWGIPGAVGAVLLGAVALALLNLVHFGLGRMGVANVPLVWSEGGRPEVLLRFSLPWPGGAWTSWLAENWREAVGYLPIALPLALATVVGGIDCTESAAAAGDEYPTGPIIAVEGVSTILGAVFGGVLQTTPYIGHPAYKAMGARAGYTLATAIFVGGAGVFGYFAWIFFLLPKAVVFPILVFIGVEITAQSFQATPRRHFPAIAFACVPALAYLAAMQVRRMFDGGGVGFGSLLPGDQRWLQTLAVVSGGGGFIVTSLIWGTILARVIDGHARTGAIVSGIAAILAFFGVIHSPLAAAPIQWPWVVVTELERMGRGSATAGMTPFHWSAAYAAVGVVLLGLERFGIAPAGEAAESGVAI